MKMDYLCRVVDPLTKGNLLVGLMILLSSLVICLGLILGVLLMTTFVRPKADRQRPADKLGRTSRRKGNSYGN